MGWTLGCLPLQLRSDIYAYLRHDAQRELRPTQRSMRGAFDDAVIRGGVRIAVHTVDKFAVDDPLPLSGWCPANVDREIPGQHASLTVIVAFPVARRPSSPPSSLLQHVARVGLVGTRHVAAGSFSDCAGIRKVFFPVDLESIGADAFAFCVGLFSVDFTPTLRTVGRGAFAGSALLRVAVPPGATVHREAFSQCPDLIEAKLPSTSRAIEAGMFRGCPSLTTVDIPSEVTEIHVGVFADCLGLRSVALPSALRSIGSDVFFNSGLTRVALPSGIREIPIRAFARCRSLSSVHLPESLTRVGDYAFAECEAMSDLVLPMALRTIDPFAFCYSGLTALTFPSDAAIGAGLFKGCPALTAVTLPLTMEVVPGRLFADCRALTSVNIPDSVTAIGKDAFESCERLEMLRLPPFLANIGSGAFARCGFTPQPDTGRVVFEAGS